jgi:plasmid stabilization system protein ParE
MAFEVVRSRGSDRDLEAIFHHLVASHQALGETLETALERAADRIRAIEDDMERLGRAPFQGTLREDLRPGLRQVTKHRAVFYFTVDEAAERVRVLAVFFGGQDHLGLMLRRLGRACG